MIRLAADLHIHSCLSPCGDRDMTPNNIANMAALKGLEMISLTDHNSARNLPATQAVCEELGLLFLPGIEVQTAEEVHLLCYFSELASALRFGDLMEKALPQIPNNKAIFGEQLVCDEEDEVVQEMDVLLLQSVRYDIAEVFSKAVSLGGLCVPAHINRQANSLLYILGFFPENPAFTAVEVSQKAPPPTVDLGKRHVLYSSDAHYLADILEADNFISLAEKSLKAFMDKYGTLKQ